MPKKILQSYDFAGNQIIDARLENLASFPTAGSAGRFVLNTTTALVGFDDGTNFRTLAPLDDPAFTGNPTAPTQTAGNNTTRLATTAFVQAAVAASGGGDMLISVYDSNDDGKVDAADSADAVPWTGVTGKPSTFAPSAHTHTLSDVTDSGALAALDTVDTAEIDDEAVTLAKMAHIATSRILGRVSASTGDVEALTAAQVKTILALAIADVSGLQSALDGKAASSHTHTASDVTDFNAEVDNRIVAYFDTEAASDNDLDTLRELIDQIKANRDDLTSQIQRYEADIGDGSSTSIAVTHNLASRDVTVEVYDTGTYETVSVGVTRTSTNVVTIDATPAPASNALRVVIKR